MKRKVLCLTVLSLLIFSNIALAASWSFVARTSKENPLNLTGGTYSEYVDKNTARKDGDILVFWHKQQDEDSSEAMLTKNEVNLSLLKTRVVESYGYNSEGKETSRDTELSGWVKYQKGSPFERKILMALKYAKEGKDTGAKPTP